MAIRLMMTKSSSSSSSKATAKSKDKDRSKTNNSSSNSDKSDADHALPSPTDTITPTTTMSWDELSHKIWTYLQATSVVSGLFNFYPHVIIKWNAMFHIVLVVKESVEHRYATQLEQERRAKEREEKRARILQFWRRWLPKFLFEWIFLRTEKKKLKAQHSTTTTTTTTTPSTSSKQSSSSASSATDTGLRQRKTSSMSTSTTETSTSSSSSSASLPSHEEIRQHVKKAKLVVQGHRESVWDDIVWGALQIAFIYHDWTNWQTFVVAWLVFLLTVLEEAILDPSLSKKQKWRKAMWIGAVAVTTGKLAFF
jgi:hypothetical protein